MDAKVELQRWAKNATFAGQILKGAAAEGLVRKKGQELQAKADSMYGAKGYGLSVERGAGRVHAFVYTGNMHCVNSNFVHQTLKKAVGR